jgi:holo-[acyl-carrier protein] synthase
MRRPLIITIPMHVIGVGTEIVECLRVGRMVEQHGEVFLARVFTADEARFCQSRRRATQHLAARWAAKQAVLKALGTAWRRGMEWADIEVREEPGASPSVELRGLIKELADAGGVGRVLLSMSHCRAYATATAVAVRE